MRISEIRIEDYLYDLPQNRIALYPLEYRDQSKLLVFRNGQTSQSSFYNLPDLLPADSVLIWNNTKVIPARLEFKKSSGALIEIFLLEPFSPSGYATVFNQDVCCIWNVIIGNQKKWKGESLVREMDSPKGIIRLSAEYAGDKNNNRILFKWLPEKLSFAQILDLFGKTPIPPYLKRDSNDIDKTRYQTVYANFDGSVAAPTAGLHFTPDLIQKLKQKNIRLDSVTLHVGAGTFIPVKSDTISDHRMHAETVIIGKSIIRDLLQIAPDKLTVVGTTTLRSLESMFWLGQKIALHPELEVNQLCVDQWEPYKYTHAIDIKHSLNTIMHFLNKRELEEIQFITRLIIVPGYPFKLVNRLITNFHQPSSTLLLLVSALIGDQWREIYHYALAHDFRFLSYGDSSLLETESFNNG